MLEVYRKGTGEGSLRGEVSCRPQEEMNEKDDEEANDELEDLSKGVSELKLQ